MPSSISALNCSVQSYAWGFNFVFFFFVFWTNIFSFLLFLIFKLSVLRLQWFALEFDKHKLRTKFFPSLLRLGIAWCETLKQLLHLLHAQPFFSLLPIKKITVASSPYAHWQISLQVILIHKKKNVIQMISGNQLYLDTVHHRACCIIRNSFWNGSSAVAFWCSHGSFSNRFLIYPIVWSVWKAICHVWSC